METIRVYLTVPEIQDGLHIAEFEAAIDCTVTSWGSEGSRTDPPDGPEWDELTYLVEGSDYTVRPTVREWLPAGDYHRFCIMKESAARLDDIAEQLMEKRYDYQGVYPRAIAERRLAMHRTTVPWRKK